jgi:hypothetical protein
MNKNRRVDLLEGNLGMSLLMVLWIKIEGLIY